MARPRARRRVAGLARRVRRRALGIVAVLHRARTSRASSPSRASAPTPSSAASSARSVLNRVSATAVHPIEYGVVLGALLPLALHRTIYRWGRPLCRCCRRADLRRLLPVGVALGGAGRRWSSFIVLLSGWPGGGASAPDALRRSRRRACGWRSPGWSARSSRCSRTWTTTPASPVAPTTTASCSGVMADNPIFGRGLFTFIPRYYRILDNQYLMFGLELGPRRAARRRCSSCRRRSSPGTAPRSGAGRRGRATSAWRCPASLLGVVVSFVTFDASASRWRPG